MAILFCAAPADAGILRYNYRVKDSSADPTARVPQLIVADTAAECPSSDVGDGDACYGKDTDTLLVRANGAWATLTTGSVTLTGDVDGPASSNDLDEVAVESELEAVLDLQDQQGAVTDAQVPNTITVDLATTATTANAGDSATAFFPAGTLEDALVDGSAEADEINPTLGNQTQGNYALGDSEGGAATTGDSASSFFGAGQLEAARGGTGIDTSASTGMPLITAGTWGVTTMPVTQIVPCPPGLNATANICQTFTDLGAAFATAGAGSNMWADLATYTQYRISVSMGGTGATTGDVVVQCDTVVNFASPTTLGQVDNPAASVITCSTAATCSGSSWAAIGAGECLTAGGIYLRAGMANGNTTEDPIVRRVTVELR